MKEINQIKEALKNIVEVPVQTFEAVVEEVDEELATCIVLIGTLTISDIRLRSVIDEGYGFYFVPKKGSKVLISRVRNSDDFFVSQFGEVDKFILKTDNTNLDFVIPGGDESDNDNFQLSFGEDTIISINGTSVDITQGESKINMAEGIVNVSQGEKTNMVLDESTVTLTQDSATMELAGENITLNGGGNKGMVMVKELTDKLNTIENLLLKFVPLYDTHFHPSAVGPTGPTTSIVSETIAPTQQTEIENTNVMH